MTTIKKIEADERRPSKQLAERLADILQIASTERAAFLQAARAELAPDQLALDSQPLAAPPQPSAPPQPTPSFPTGTLTFLFTDIVASTRQWEQQTEAMASALARHYVLVQQAIDAHGGSVVKSTGDGLLAAFAVAADGVAAALAAQRALVREPWGTPEPIRVRMALHTGAAELRDGDYYGPTLNRAARLVAAGHGEQILLSLATAELVRDRLPPEVQLRELGTYGLKDLSRPERVFQVVAPELCADFPPLATREQRRQQLPAQSTALIGREQEVARLCVLLRRADMRLVTLTGPGGIGKTRLGLQVAWELGDLATHSFWFVPLEAIGDPELVVSAIAQTLGVQEVGGQPLVESLKTYLHDKQLVLVLDNFEQVVDAAPLISELLAAAPKLKVLITSRMRLNLTGEREFVVPPLALPDPLRLPPLERMAEYAAVRLFVERAQAAKDSFVLTEANAPAVAEICYRLDGLPLALELAAARVKLFSPETLLARLSSPLRLLIGGPRDLPARQQTIRNTIDWSYQLLGGGEKRLFARLGVFVGGCTLEAAEAVCNPDRDLLLDAFEGLASLVDKSLLRQVEGSEGEPRFVMLETIREYALERLEQSGEAERVRRRHADYYLALADLAASKFTGGEQALWLNRVEEEHDNLRAAIQRELARGHVEMTARFGQALLRFWIVRGYWSEGRKWLNAVLAQAENIPAALRAQLIRAAFSLAIYQGGAAQLTELLTASLAIFRELDDPIGIADVQHKLGLLALQRGDVEHAADLFVQNLAVYQELDDKRGIATTLSDMGSVALYQNDLQRARTLLQESLALRRALDDRRRIAATLITLGEVARSALDLDQAAKHYNEGLAIYQELGHRGGVALAFHNLGWVALAQEDSGRATALFTESLVIFRDLQSSQRITDCLAGLAAVVIIQGRLVQAVRLFGAVQAARTRINATVDPVDHAAYDYYIATARAQLDDATFEAASAAGQAMTLEQAIAEALAG